MPSFRTVALATIAAFVSVANAQDYWVDPESVPPGTRQRWCDDQERTCPILCEQVAPRTTLVNECDPDTFNYGCLCGNEKQPNMTEYTLTLPFHLCREFVQQCSDKCNLNSRCITDCVELNPCGASNPSRATSTSSTSRPGPTQASSEEEDPDQVFDGPSGAIAEEDDEDSAFALQRNVGFVGLVAGMLALLGAL